MRDKDIFSNKNKLFLIKIIYLTMLVSYFILFVFLFFTNGSIRYFIQQNMLYILIPLSLPLILSLVGLNDFKIEKNAEHIKIYSNCIFMSNFSDNYSKVIIVNINEPFQKIKNKSVKSKINISLLSRLEQEDLQQKLNISK